MFTTIKYLEPKFKSPIIFRADSLKVGTWFWVESDPQTVENLYIVTKEVLCGEAFIVGMYVKTGNLTSIPQTTYVYICDSVMISDPRPRLECI